MIHPSELLRTNSQSARGFSAPLGDYRNDIDCGVKALPFLNKCLRLDRFAKPGIFVAVLSVAGFFFGTLLHYFRGASKIWSEHYSIPQWFVYVNEILVGIFALCVAYWGNRIHRTAWIGSLTIYLSIASATLAVPEIYRPFSEQETNITGPSLCQSNLIQLSSSVHEFHQVAFAVLLVYQILYAATTISLICHGITYIDDNMAPKNSPGFIGLALAAYEVGKQAGTYCSWAPFVFKIESIFVSPVWLFISALVFITGCTLSMFPKTMPNTLMKKSVTSILNLASGNVVPDYEETIDGFFKSLYRIMRNKILLLNIFSMVLIQSAIVNFSILEKFFNQSKYHVSQNDDTSSYSDPALIQFTSNLLKQPLVAISVVTSGMLIAKMRPKARHLIIWNIIVFLLMALLFASTSFWKCAGKLKNEHSNKLTIPYCSWSCGCSTDGPFQPVCLNGDTYFSPCFAGCKTTDGIANGYQNCSCGWGDRTVAADGSCDSKNCNIILAVAQVNQVISAGLLATTMVSNMIINMRCVESKDKALALGLYLTFVGLVPHLPIRAIYRAVTDNFCQIHGKYTCQFYSEYFTIFLSSATISFMVLAALVSLILLFTLNNFELYQNNNSLHASDIELRPNNNTNSNAVEATPEESTTLIHNTDENKVISRSNRRDRIQSYLSEGDLVPSLKKQTTLETEL